MTVLERTALTRFVEEWAEAVLAALRWLTSTR
jgi:hypothetical protein